MENDHSGYQSIEYYLNGNYKSLVPTVDTEWLIGGGEIKVAAGHCVEFFETGTFKSLVLAEDTSVVVHGVSAQLAAGSEIQLYASGALRRITLAPQERGILFGSENWDYQGLTIAPFTTIEFRPDGSIRSLLKAHGCK